MLGSERADFGGGETGGEETVEAEGKRGCGCYGGLGTGLRVEVGGDARGGSECCGCRGCEGDFLRELGACKGVGKRGVNVDWPIDFHWRFSVSCGRSRCGWDEAEGGEGGVGCEEVPVVD